MAEQYHEVNESLILEAIQLLTENGEKCDGFKKILQIGTTYREYGLTPVYVADEEENFFKVLIAETRDFSKLH